MVKGEHDNEPLRRNRHRCWLYGCGDLLPPGQGKTPRLGLERFGITHAYGSHAGESRVIRLAYREGPSYVNLVKRAAARWRALEAEVGSDLFSATGVLLLSEIGEDVLDRSTRVADQCGVRCEKLSHEDLRQRFPQFTLPPAKQGLWDIDAGFLRPERCIESLVEVAQREGADVHAYESVSSWKPDGGSYRVATPEAVYHADRLVFTAGAWTDRLVRDLGVTLTLSRKVQAWFRPIRPERFTPDVFPVWFIQIEQGQNLYGFPLVDGGFGVKVAEHNHLDETTLDVVSRDPTLNDRTILRQELRKLLPDAAGPILGMRVCLYTNSPDGDFIVDRHSQHDGVVLGCGFSDHGFKFASAVGEVLAKLALDEDSGLDVGFLGLGRFA